MNFSCVHWISVERLRTLHFCEKGCMVCITKFNVCHGIVTFA